MLHSSSSSWFRPRSYIHFDEKITAQKQRWVTKFVSNPKNVAGHAFFPFLHYNKPKYKYETTSEGSRKFELGERPICYAAHLDAQIYAYYSSLPSQKYELRLQAAGLSQNVIGFRKLRDKEGNAKSNIHLARDAFSKVQELGNCRVYAFDIKSFFSSLDARHLKSAWKNLLSVDELPKDHFNVFRSLTKYKIVRRDNLFHEMRVPRSPRAQRLQDINRVCDGKYFREFVVEKSETVGHGIPQGSPISATLANIYMLSFDSIVADEVASRRGFYFRYCDDIFVILPTELNFDVETFVAGNLASLGLSLNRKKTDKSTFTRVGDKTSFDKPIQYLGFKFDGRVTSIRPGSISCYLRDLQKSVDKAIAVKLYARHRGGT